MRDGVVEGSGSLDHLVFNAHWYGTVYGSLKFRLHRNATAAAGIEPTTLGSAAEHLTTAPPRRTAKLYFARRWKKVALREYAEIIIKKQCYSIPRRPSKGLCACTSFF